MKLGQTIILFMVVMIGGLMLVWWVRWHRLPTLRLSYTIGKGGDLGLDWIDLRRSLDEQA